MGAASPDRIGSANCLFGVSNLHQPNDQKSVKWRPVAVPSEKNFIPTAIFISLYRRIAWGGVANGLRQ